MRTHTALSALALVASAGLLVAGPLSPPAGPVASSYKTLSDVEPRTAINAANTPGDASSVYRIAQPGSYYLTGNITGVPGKTAIVIACDRVTLDLAGFSITGGSTAVAAPVIVQSITVRNGIVAGCGAFGLFLPNATDARVEDLHVSQCGTYAIYVGDRTAVLRCDCRQADIGFVWGKDSRIEDCTSSACTNFGFRSFEPGATLRRCTAAGNLVNGFDLNGSDRCVLDSCAARSNSGIGFILGTATQMSRCTANLNGDVGIVAESGCTVDHCVVSGNTHQGIHIVGPDCIATANQALHNGPGLAGIWISSTGAVVQDNLSSNQGFGLYVDGTHNLITRNACRGNTNSNFSINAANELAPIVTNPGSNAFATVTPQSNLAY